jgi:hypothetical protein
MKSADAVRIFKSRDSATSVLRKIGIKPRDYNFFIEKLTDGTFACQVARAEAHLASLQAPATKKVVGTFDDLLTLAGQAQEKKSAGGGRNYDRPRNKTVRSCEGIGEICKSMILAGKTNKEIWEHIKEKFNLQDNKKRGYPAWYRGFLKRQGSANG